MQSTNDALILARLHPDFIYTGGGDETKFVIQTLRVENRRLRAQLAQLQQEHNVQTNDEQVDTSSNLSMLTESIVTGLAYAQRDEPLNVKMQRCTTVLEALQLLIDYNPEDVLSLFKPSDGMLITRMARVRLRSYGFSPQSNDVWVQSRTIHKDQLLHA